MINRKIVWSERQCGEMKNVSALFPFISFFSGEDLARNNNGNSLSSYILAKKYVADCAFPIHSRKFNSFCVASRTRKYGISKPNLNLDFFTLSVSRRISHSAHLILENGPLQSRWWIEEVMQYYTVRFNLFIEMAKHNKYNTHGKKWTLECQ